MNSTGHTINSKRRGRFVWLPLLLSVVWGSAASRAATYYVDGNCPSSGSGASIVCGSNGPKKTITEGIALLAAGSSDVLRVRGVHPAHDGETAAFDGRYFADKYDLALSGNATNPIVIEAYGFSGTAGEKVYLDGTRAPSSGWRICSDCSTGPCAGVPATACSQTWYATDSGTASLVIGAQKDDGTPTYRVASLSDLTNSHAGYAGTSPEIDSYSPQSGGAILVRWGSSLPNRPYVFNNNEGTGFTFLATSANLIVRGFTFRCHRRGSLYFYPATTPKNVTGSNNIIYYTADVKGNGSDYGVTLYNVTGVTIASNEIAWTGSEGIHGQAMPSGPTANIIRDNWIHDTGDVNVLGPAVIGTPSGMIIGDSGNGAVAGDYTGTVVEGNLIENTRATLSSGRGFIMENHVDNMIVRNNIFHNTHGEGLKLDANTVSMNNNQVYNNLFVTNSDGGSGHGLQVYAAPGLTANNNKFYNNTFVNNLLGAMGITCLGTCTGNEFRNNIMYASSAQKVVDWAGSGIFQYNLVYAPTSNNLVSFNGRSFSCSGVTTSSDIDGDGVANDNNRCANPGFVAPSSNDFHLLSSSAAINVGTSLGLPSGRTNSVNNRIAAQHGLPAYADNLPMLGSSWDAGAVEYGSVAGVTANLSLSDPSPTGPGTVSVTLSTLTSVVQLPGPLTFLESDGTTTVIVLSGTVPGSTFMGSFAVNSSVADGLGTFSLPLNSLLDSLGNKGNTIASGSQTLIDKAPPSSPQNLRFGN
ncbi:MAG TPA: right-handed parallel beta-helix repeat-containing protein [Candidatus Polarisedimenticolia bacterium]|nr:right-handed parallel beta-helix repeat-containing protein [Candidatus Polarisedimenticolia bacterium]